MWWVTKTHVIVILLLLLLSLLLLLLRNHFLWDRLNLYFLCFLRPESSEILRIVWASSTNTHTFSHYLYFILFLNDLIISIGILISTKRIHSTPTNTSTQSSTLKFKIVLYILHMNIIWSVSNWFWQNSVNFTIKLHWKFDKSSF